MSDDIRRKFIEDFVEKVNKIYEGYLDEYGIEHNDVAYQLNVGVYTKDEDDKKYMIIGTMTTAIDEDELHLLVESSVTQFLKEREEPKEGTIEWWIKNFGNDQNLN